MIISSYSGIKVLCTRKHKCITF